MSTPMTPGGGGGRGRKEIAVNVSAAPSAGGPSTPLRRRVEPLETPLPRPAVVPEPQQGTVGHAFRLALAGIASWFLFLAVLTLFAIGVHFGSDASRSAFTILGSSMIWWVVLMWVCVVGWFLLRFAATAVAALVVRICRSRVVASSPLSVVGLVADVAAPFSKDAARAAWVVLITAVYGALLSGSVPRGQDLTGEADARIVKLLAAMLVCTVVLAVKRAILVFAGGAAHADLADDLRRVAVETEVLGSLRDEQRREPRTDAELALDATVDIGDHAVPKGVLGWLRLSSMASRVREQGLHAIDERLPRGEESLTVPEILLRSEACYASDDLFTLIATPGEPYINLVACQDYCRSNARGATLFALLARNGEVEVSKESMRGAMQQTFIDRAAFLGLLFARTTAVRVAADILAAVASLVIAFVVLDAFEIDTSPIRTTSLTVIACLAYVLAPGLRAAVVSLHMIFFERPYDIGDWVAIDAGQESEELLQVRRVRVLVTLFRTESGCRVFVPNSTIADAKVYNLTRAQRVSDRIVNLRLSREYIPKGREASTLAERLVLQSGSAKQRR